MKRSILFLFLLSIANLSAQTVGDTLFYNSIAGNCSNSNTMNQYDFITLMDVQYDLEGYEIVNYRDCNGNSNYYGVLTPKLYITDNSNTYSADTLEVDFKEKDDYWAGELSLSSSTTSLGFILFDNVSVTTTTKDVYEDPSDTTSTKLGNDVEGYRRSAYLISFEGDTDYSSEYTPSQVTETLLFNNGDEYCYKIVDDDRDWIVGFRYYCKNRSQEFTNYFLPNN